MPLKTDTEYSESNDGSPHEKDPVVPPENSKDQHTSKASQVPLCYNMGFGDFCFGQAPVFRAPDQNETTPTMGSKHAGLQEHNDFESTGSFAFFKLPLQIRQQIYSDILSLARQYRVESDQAVVGSTFLSVERIRLLDPTSRLLKGYESIGQVDNISQLLPHPGRTVNYYLSSIPWSTLWHPLVRALIVSNQPIHELIRNLANTSCQIRKEMADVFWQNITIECIGLRTLGHELRYFFEQRPATYAAIRHFRACITQDIYSDYVGNPSEWKQAFKETCIFIAQNLQLESFHLELRVTEDELDEYENGDKTRLDYLVALRQLKVSRTFKISLVIRPEEFDIDDSSEEWLKLKGALEVKNRPVLEEMLKPDTLRHRMRTEEEKYLKARAMVVAKGGWK